MGDKIGSVTAVGGAYSSVITIGRRPNGALDGPEHNPGLTEQVMTPQSCSTRRSIHDHRQDSGRPVGRDDPLDGRFSGVSFTFHVHLRHICLSVGEEH